MAQKHDHDEDLAADETPGYKPPAQKSVAEILQADAGDESLQKYKQALLGIVAGEKPEPFPNDPRHVIVEKVSLLVQGRPEIEIDLSNISKDQKKKCLVLKEGCEYRVKIYFYVQRDIVQGLKYVQMTYKAGIRVDKSTTMVGNYGPKKEVQSFTAPAEEAPSGMLARGSYTIKSLFTDDDKNEHLKWEWKVDIKKEWD